MTVISPEALDEAYRYCDRMAQARAKNFYPAFRFLSRDRRLGLSAFYAFCTLSDDISDDHSPLPYPPRVQRLQDWQDSLKRGLAGQADHPMFLALHDAMHKFDLPPEPFFDLLEGIRMDLEPRRYDTFAELEIYCRRVASSVGRVSVRIFGCTSVEADRYAEALGIAFQLTNILRDLGEDLSRDRIYLPLEDLAQFKYTEADLCNRTYDQRFSDLMEFQYQRACTFFHTADPAGVGRQARLLFPAQVMKAVYWQILQELKRRDFHIWEERISIPRWRKFSAIITALVRHYF